MDKKSTYTIAENYLAGNLNEEEKIQVDKRLETDKAFGLEFAKSLIIKQEVKELDEAEWKQELMAELRAKKKTSPELKQSKVLNLRRFMAVAAAILLVAFATFLLWKQPSNTALYAEASNEIFQERISNLDVRSSKENFVELFENGDFVQALKVAEEQMPQAEELDQLNWLERQGFCHLKLKQWDKALLIFNQLAENELLLPTQNPASWYIALTYLGMEDIDKTKAVLKAHLANKVVVYKEEAASLLEKLNQ